eukprot:218717_1
MDEHYLSKLWLFIDAYTRLAIQSQILDDIIEILCLFYSDKHTAFILSITSNNNTSQIMQLFDIYTSKSYPIDLYFTSSKNTFKPAYFSKPKSQCISHQCSLPNKMKTKCLSTYNDQLSTESVKLFSSNKWNLIFRIGPVSSITALHPEFCDTMYSEPDEYYGYNFVIPTFKKYSYSRCVYNETQQILYKSEGEQIYSLCLTDTKCDENWKWNVWQENINPYIEAGTSVCMIDNDKYMALINANDKESYLFTMNESKSIIRIADACVVRCMGYSMYHNIYYKIATIGEYTAEWYDINKDKSMIICEYKNQPKRINNVWYHPLDPNVLYCAVEYKMGQQLFTTQLDLRNGKWYRQEFCKVFKGVDTDCVYLRY